LEEILQTGCPDPLAGSEKQPVLPRARKHFFRVETRSWVEMDQGTEFRAEGPALLLVAVTGVPVMFGRGHEFWAAGVRLLRGMSRRRG
jgi:hypothetical protein